MIRTSSRFQATSFALYIIILASASTSQAQMKLMSPTIAPGAPIANDYACTGGDRSPSLSWSNAPQNTKTFALVVEDPDAPGGTFIHWVAYNIPARVTALPEGVPQSAEIAGGGKNGINEFDHVGYNGPCPPPGKVHHYHFRLYALDSTIDPGDKADASAVKSAMNGHVLASAELVGTFQK
jgi:Raf kinase inhibitor-like YbhB/YbcL family protein